MRGVKAKALRSMAKAVAAKFPPIEYVKKPMDKVFIIQTALGPQRKTLRLHQWFLGKCQRKVYKQFKKTYKLQAKLGGGLIHD